MAESLLILGLEGSRNGKSQLWVFNPAPEPMRVRRQGEGEAYKGKPMLKRMQNHGRHTSGKRTGVRRKIELSVTKFMLT